MIAARFGLAGSEIAHLGDQRKELLVANALAGFHRRQHIRQFLEPVLARILGETELPRADIRPRQPAAVRRRVDGSEIIGLFLVEYILFDERAGGDHAHDIALDHALALFGIGELFADGDAAAGVYEAADIVVHRVIRHAAHGRAPLKPAVPAGEHEIEYA